MGRMIRKQIVIDRKLEERVSRLAGERGVSQSELIRQALGDYLERVMREGERHKAHQELMEMLRTSTFRAPVDKEGNRIWTRESLYDRGPR